MEKNKQHFDEMIAGAGEVRSPYSGYDKWFAQQDPDHLTRKSQEAETFFRRSGITFNVYGQAEAQERLIPFDVVPRVLSAREWRKLSKGIEQRVRALNAFLHDIYHRQEIVRSGRLPREMVEHNAAFLPQMIGVEPPGGIYTHIVGIDLVRTGDRHAERGRSDEGTVGGHVSAPRRRGSHDDFAQADLGLSGPRRGGACRTARRKEEGCQKRGAEQHGAVEGCRDGTPEGRRK